MAVVLREKLYGVFGFLRFFSSVRVSNGETTRLGHALSDGERLTARILKLVNPRRSAEDVLRKWADEGGGWLPISELRSISRLLLKRRRFKHALEILTWMEANDRYRMSYADRAMRLELTIKVRSLREAEEYFENLPDSVSRKAACLPLLNFYVRERSTAKAEGLMLTMNKSGFLVTPHPFNAMMKLYIATSQPNKVLAVIELMKQNQMPRNVLSYNLWMNACAEVSGVGSCETVYKEMLQDKRVLVGWSSLCTLANIYQKFELADKACWALREAEKKLSTCNRLGFLFLITIYASLNKKGEVLRLWEVCKRVRGRLTCANYMCVLSCLVKIGDIKQAETIFLEWESQCRTYDIRVSNILLGAYMRNGLTKKAEALHICSLDKGGSPNYKTWEILMEGWVKSRDMDKAIDAMRNGLSMLENCDWRPSASMVVAMAKYFESEGKIEDAKQYLGIIRPFGLATLPVYESLLRVHSRFQRPVEDIIELMHQDGFDTRHNIS